MPTPMCNRNCETLFTIGLNFPLKKMSAKRTVTPPKLRLLNAESFEKERFDDQGVTTKTSEEQIKVEQKIHSICHVTRDVISVDPRCPCLERDRHITFVKKGLGSVPAVFEVFDSSRPWFCYWIIHVFELLEEPISKDTKFNMINFLGLCQDPLGGFAGGPGQEPHLAPTYAAVNALCILRCDEAYEIIDRKKLLNFLLRMKNKDGSFSLHHSSETDIRGTYCALAVARLTNLWVPELLENTAEWIASCQTYEGGFGAVPYAEAHGGYTFCGFASLVLMNRETACNINSLLRWLVNRQMRFEGGFQGRTNKLVDSCYSFWQAGVFPLLHRKLCKTECETMSTDNWLFDQAALQEYLLVNCQPVYGGMIDKPKKMPDFYHTCYALSGLSIAQHFAGGQIGHTLVVGDPENELCATHPIYNITFEAAIRASQYFSSLPIPEYR